VPLSEHEQRLLDQIERALLAEDPKFASTVRATHGGSYVRRRRVIAGLLVLVGLGLMAFGVFGGGPAVGGLPLVGVLGFLVAFGAVVFGVSARRTPAAAPLRAVGSDRPTKDRPRRSGGVVDRLEDRWRRRADDGR